MAVSKTLSGVTHAGNSRSFSVNTGSSNVPYSAYGYTITEQTNCVLSNVICYSSPPSVNGSVQVTNPGSYRFKMNVTKSSGSFELIVTGNAGSNLVIATEPTKLNYTVGDTLDTTGMVVNVKYSDDSTDTLSSNQYTCSPTTLNTAGGAIQISVTNNYSTPSSMSTTFRVSVSDVPPLPTLIGISVDEAPDKTLYVVGESFDPTGMVVVALYDDSSEEILTQSQYTWSPSTFTTAGASVPVTISYGGFSATTNVYVGEGPTPGPSYIQYTGVPLTAGTYNVECQDDNGNPLTLVVNVVSSGPPGPGPDPPSQESYIQYSGRPLTPGRYGPIYCTNDSGGPISLYINVEGLPTSDSRCSLTRYDKGGVSVWDIPNVQSIETTDSAQLTEVSTIIYGFDNNFCMDTGTVEKYTITFRRVQPFDCDDGSSDPADWSNGYWFIRFKEFIDGWQNLNYGIVDGEWVRTGGFKFHFEPGTESYRDDEPYSDLHPIIDRTVFINGTISMSMSGSNLQYINVSLPLSVGSMIRHKQTVGGHEVTLDSDIQDIGTYAARYPVGFNFPAPNAPLKWLLRPETGLMSFKHWYPGTSTGTAIYPGTIVEYSINRLTATWDSPIATYEFTENTTLSTFPSGAKRMRLWVISGAGGGGGGAQRAIYSRRAGGGGGSGGFLASALGFDSTGLISMTFTIGAGGAGGGGGMTPTDGGNGGDSTVTMTYQGEGSEIYDVLVASVAGGRGGKAPPNGGAGGSGGSDGGVSGNSAGVEVVTRPDGTTYDWHVGGNGGVPSGLPVTLGQYSIPSVAGAGGTRESGGGGNGDGYGAGGGGGAQGTYRGGAGSGGYILIAFYA